MADITMCKQDNCQNRTICYRYTAKPSEYMQSYFRCDPRNSDGTCPEFVECRYPASINAAMRGGETVFAMTPKLLREAVAECAEWCDNCPTPDACMLRGKCAHKMREDDAALEEKGK